MYIDPGFAGMLIQLGVLLIATGGATLFLVRKKIRNFFSKNKNANIIANNPIKGETLNEDVIDMLADEDN